MLSLVLSVAACSFDTSGLPNNNSNNFNNTSNVNNVSNANNTGNTNNNNISNTNNSNNTNNTNNLAPICGDNEINQTSEECDGDDLAGSTCPEHGYDMGTLVCSQGCTFDMSGCYNDLCGNGALDPGEECDGMNFGSRTCAKRSERDLWMGSLVCNSDCGPHLK